MANSLIHPAVVAIAAMRHLAAIVDGAGELVYEDSFSVPGARAGFVVNYRLPFVFDPRPLPWSQVSVEVMPIRLDQELTIPMIISDQDLTMTADLFDRRFIEPAAVSLASSLLRSWPLGHVMAVAKLDLPGGFEWSERVTNPRFTLGLRLMRYYDIRTNRKHTQIDMLVGTANPDAGSSVALIESPRLKALVAMKAELEAQREKLRAAGK